MSEDNFKLVSIKDLKLMTNIYYETCLILHVDRVFFGMNEGKWVPGHSGIRGKDKAMN